MSLAALTPAEDNSPRARFSALHRIVRDRICLLEYAPGAAISEAELAREFGLSRTPIRRVVQMLEAEGLVETKPNVGSIVTAVDLKSLRDAFALRVKLAEMLGDMSPTHELGLIVAEMSALLSHCRHLIDQRDVSGLCLISHRLQHSLLALSGNSEYQQISEALYFKTIRAYYTILADLEWRTEVDAQVAEINDIVLSLNTGDVRAVGLIRRNHIIRTLSRITTFLMPEMPRAGGLV